MSHQKPRPEDDDLPGGAVADDAETEIDLDAPLGMSFGAALRRAASSPPGSVAVDRFDDPLLEAFYAAKGASPPGLQPPQAGPDAPPFPAPAPPPELDVDPDDPTLKAARMIAAAGRLGLMLDDVEREPAAPQLGVHAPIDAEDDAGPVEAADARPAFRSPFESSLDPSPEEGPNDLYTVDGDDDLPGGAGAPRSLWGPDDEPPPPPLQDLDPEEEDDASGEAVAAPRAEDPAASGEMDFAADPIVGDRMLPRIAIHAFCSHVNLLGLLDAARRDRRMQNVTLEVFEGGVTRARELYLNETTPNLIVIEAMGPPRQVLNELDQLAELCDESVRVFVIGATNDIAFYRELMRRGVSEYLVQPIQPVQLIRSVSALFTDPHAPFTGRTLAVTGVKGGVGASAVAHNLAWALAERIRVNATLVDLDLNFGTTGLDFNQDANATIADALISPDRFDDAIMNRIMTKATDRLSLFTAPATLDRTYDIDPHVYQRVLDQVRSSVPFIVLDLPHIWSDWFKATIMGSDEIIVVAAPDLASLRNGKNLIDFLKAARPNDSPPKLVLNMVGMPKRPEIPPKEFGQAIGMEPSLILPFDPHLFGTAANNGQMVFDVAAGAKASVAIDQLASMVSGRSPQEKRSSLLDRFMKR